MELLHAVHKNFKQELLKNCYAHFHQPTLVLQLTHVQRRAYFNCVHHNLPLDVHCSIA